ncbi:MAG: caspase family protein [Bacteroidota bacterium]
MKTRDEININTHPATPLKPKGKNYLFIIAVDQYANGISPLHNAVRDAVAFREVLLEHYQFEAEQCVSLIDKAATRNHFDQQFIRLNQQLTEEDNLVFYFSGHGTLSKERQQGYWLLQDAIKGDYTTYLPNFEVINFIKSCPARHVYGIVDACFSGTLFRNETPEPPSRLYHYRSRYLLTAGREERVLDGPMGKNSPFADTLLQQLKDPNQERIWGVDLARNVLKFIQYQTDVQTPRGDYLKEVQHAGGEMIFLKKNTSLPDSPKANTAQQIETNRGVQEERGKTLHQKADKIYNIDKIDNAEFH